MSVKKNGKVLLYMGIILGMFLLAVVIMFGRQILPGVWADSGYYETVTVEKVWDDAEDTSQRPESVTVKVAYHDSDGVHGEQRLNLSEENNWKHTFPSSWDIMFLGEESVSGYAMSDSSFISDGNGGYTLRIVNGKLHPVSYTWTWEDLDEPPRYPYLPGINNHAAGTKVEVNESYREGSLTEVDGVYYNFSGWDRDDFIMPKEPVVISGQWIKAPLYKVNYEWAGLPENKKVTLKNGSEVSLPKGEEGLPKGKSYYVDYRYEKGIYAEAEDGTLYRFSGWSTEDVPDYDGNYYIYMPGQDVTFVGEWKQVQPNTVNYEWEFEGGKPGGISVNLPSAEKHVAGETVTRDGTYKKGYVVRDSTANAIYTFSGWRKGAYGTEDFAADFEENFTMPSEDVTIYGYWEKENGYQVSYRWTWEGLSNPPSYANVDGENQWLYSEDYNSYKKGNTVERYNTAFKKGTVVAYNGQLYRFSGWNAYEKNNDANVLFTVNDADTSFTMPGCNVMIEGQWKKLDEASYNVNYEWTGVSKDLLDRFYYELRVPKSDRTYVAGEQITVNKEYWQHSYYNGVSEDHPFMLGNRAFIFSGWREGAIDTPEFAHKYGETFTMPAKDVTLYGSLEELASYRVEWYEVPSADADVSTAKLMYDRSPNPVVRYAKDESHVAIKENDKKVKNWTFVKDYSANVLEADTSMENPAVLKLYFTKAPNPVQTYNLTIHYVDENNQKIHADYTKNDLEKGDTYNVTSPAIDGYTLKDAAQSAVSGEMPDQDVELYVVYKLNPNQPNPPTPIITYTVTYTDGVEGEVVFPDQVTSNLFYGEKTPLFRMVMSLAEGHSSALLGLAEANQTFGDIPVREGYVFTGWTPVVSETVTGDAVYTANWEKKTTNIDDGDTPLGPDPGDDDPGIDDPIIDDPEVPLSPGKTDETDEKTSVKNPKTGDNSSVSLWMMLLAAAGSGLVCLVRGQKRRREDA